MTGICYFSTNHASHQQVQRQQEPIYQTKNVEATDYTAQFSILIISYVLLLLKTNTIAPIFFVTALILNSQPPVVFEQTPSDPEQLRHNLMNTAGFHSPFKNACTIVTPARSTC